MKAPEVKALVDVLEERLNNALNAFERLDEDCKGNAQSLHELRRQVDRVLPLLEEAVHELKRWKAEDDKETDAYVNLKRDVTDLKKWKEDQKKEADERTRRWWAFGPNLVAAGIALAGTLLTIAINVALTLYLNKKS